MHFSIEMFPVVVVVVVFVSMYNKNIASLFAVVNKLSNYY